MSYTLKHISIRSEILSRVGVHPADSKPRSVISKQMMMLVTRVCTSTFLPPSPSRILICVQQRPFCPQQASLLLDVDAAEDHLLEEEARNLDLFDNRVRRDPGCGLGEQFVKKGRMPVDKCRTNRINGGIYEDPACLPRLHHEMEPRVQDNRFPRDHHDPSRPHNNCICNIVARYRLIDVIEL